MNKCFFCGRNAETSLTEIDDDGNVHEGHICDVCRESHLSEPIDLDAITDPEQLLSLIRGRRPCRCGMTESDFDDSGRFGCPECYHHFDGKMEELVFPFHKSRRHEGKSPKRLDDPDERHKVLRLRYAKAIETENYELASAIKRELDATKCP